MRLLQTILFLFLTAHSFATNYYVGSGGNDSWSGLSQGTRWATLTKVNSFFSSLNPGDSILFNRGDTFVGGLIISRSGSAGNTIGIGAYGTGAKPVITGFATLSSWTSLGSNKYSASINSGAKLNTVIVSNTLTAPGRFPNASAANGGYLTVDSYTPTSGTVQGATNTLTDAALTGGPYTGYVVVRNNYFTMSSNKITAHSGQTISWIEPTIFPASVGFGYFIQDDILALDIQNEWTYNPTAHTITMWSASTPANVQASTVEELVTINNKSYVGLRDLQFIGSDSAALHIYGGSNHIEIRNCDFDNNGTESISTWEGQSSTYVTIDSCTINHTGSSAIQMYGTDHMTITNNTIKNTGLNPGMGSWGSYGYIAIAMNGYNNLFQYNNIDSCGGVGIAFAGQNNTVINNRIRYYCTIQNDFGGSYTHNSGYPIGNKFIGNLVIDGASGVFGTDGAIVSNGGYADEDERNLEVRGNLFLRAVGNGYYIHEANNIRIVGNTFFNSTGQLSIANDDGTARAHDIDIKNNIFYSSRISDPLIYVREFDGIGFPALITGLDSNYYWRPFNNSGHVRIDLPGVRQFYNPVGMAGAYGYDAHSTIGAPIPRFTSLSVSANTFGNSSFTSTTSGAATADGNSTVSIEAKLDGNALKTSSSAGITTDLNTIISFGAMTAGHLYRIQFSAVGSVNKANIRVLFMQGFYNGYFGDDYFVPLSTSRSENTIYVTPDATKSDARMVLELRSTSMPFWIDNLTVQDVTSYTTSTLADSVIVEYNDTRANVVRTLPGNYRDVFGTPYTGRITLMPYTSSVLHKENNASPVANAGTNITITLPTASTALNGIGSDADGTISAYKWTQISGPNTGSFSSTTTTNPTFSSLTSGLYILQLRVTDNAGYQDSSTVNVTVNTAINTAPMANAGTDKIVQAPVSVTTLSGSGTDTEGSVTYNWSKVSGPSSFAITSQTSASTGITGLVVGTYVFRLTVTDAGSLTATDDVTVTVNPAPNIPPVANAGADMVVVLPTSYAVLNGSMSSDPDGSIVSYSWTKISGGSYSISNPTLAGPTLNGLTEGTYQFRLTVTDNNGATATDDIYITVMPEGSSGVNSIRAFKKFEIISQ